MFDIGGLELLVIAIVLIVVVGPKDLPRMLRTFGRMSSQLRRMAGDFRRQFDEALQEAELDEVRKTVNDVRSLDPRASIQKNLNPIRAVGDEIRSSLKAATAAPAPRVPQAGEAATPAASPMAMSSNPLGPPAGDATANAAVDPKAEATSQPAAAYPNPPADSPAPARAGEPT